MNLFLVVGAMNDEGVTHYNSIIDQHSLGAEFLRDQFGECGRPKSVGKLIHLVIHEKSLHSLHRLVN